MGEGCPNDADLMGFVSSVNIACGYHAGDTATMRRTVETAIENGVAIGAHPGYRDPQHFGRVAMDLSTDEIEAMVSEQIAALARICLDAGGVLRHVKPHGALYNQAARDNNIARAIARSVFSFDPQLVLFGLSGSQSISEAAAMGLRTASEVFADRTYRPDGSLTPRSEPNALISDPAAAADQVLQMVNESTVKAADGKTVPIVADTVCIHGDGDHALDIVMAVRTRLNESGVLVSA